MWKKMKRKQRENTCTIIIKKFLSEKKDLFHVIPHGKSHWFQPVVVDKLGMVLEKK